MTFKEPENLIFHRHELHNNSNDTHRRIRKISHPQSSFLRQKNEASKW
jgi:hypothetical protein